MEYEIKKLAKSEVQLTITVSEEEMSQHRQKALAEISKDVKVKGFRPGHVPANVIEEHVDKKYIEAHAQEIAIQRAYADAVIKENIQVVARPKVKIEKDEPLTFTATVAVLPEVEIKDYKSIKIKKGDAKVTEKDVEDIKASVEGRDWF